jgi:hypothetical protein
MLYTTYTSSIQIHTDIHFYRLRKTTYFVPPDISDFDIPMALKLKIMIFSDLLPDYKASHLKAPNLQYTRYISYTV